MYFARLFKIFFLQAFAPKEINCGSDRTRGGEPRLGTSNLRAVIARIELISQEYPIKSQYASDIPDCSYPSEAFSNSSTHDAIAVASRVFASPHLI